MLNFLIVEGYRECAAKFVQESAIDLNDPHNKDILLDFNDELINKRSHVRKLVLNGRIQEAIALLIDINPTVSDLIVV